MNSESICLLALDEIGAAHIRTSFRSEVLLDRTSSLAAAFCTLDDVARLRVVDHASRRAQRNLLILSSSCAEKAINTRNPRWIRVAVIAHAIEDFRTDYRDNVQELVLIYCAAEAVGVELQSVCHEIFHLCSERARIRFEEFCRRPKELNDPRMFGIAVSNVDGRVRFMPASPESGC